MGSQSGPDPYRTASESPARNQGIHPLHGHQLHGPELDGPELQSQRLSAPRLFRGQFNEPTSGRFNLEKYQQGKSTSCSADTEVFLSDEDGLHQESVTSRWSLSAERRFLEGVIAFVVLSVAFIPMLLIALCVRLSSPGPALFIQERVGRRGRLFRIYKFRSMATRTHLHAGPGLTRDGDSRVTSLGYWLRKLKLDEIPQFYNVLRGEMSLVGPRPKLPRYEGMTNMPYRPGITGAATLAFRHEEEILRGVQPKDLDSFYAEHIQPLKVQLDARYMCRATLRSDLELIAYTFLACAAPSLVPADYGAVILPAGIHSTAGMGEKRMPQRMETLN